MGKLDCIRQTKHPHGQRVDLFFAAPIESLGNDARPARYAGRAIAAPQANDSSRRHAATRANPSMRNVSAGGKCRASSS
jgi:hypothetical protein